MEIEINQKQSKDPFRKDEIEQIVLQPNVARKLLNRIQVEYKNKLHKLKKILKKL